MLNHGDYRSGRGLAGAAAREMARAQMRFGFRLLQELAAREPGRNVFLSPYSVAAALLVALNGAEGETQAALARVLQLEKENLETINWGSAMLGEALEKLVPEVHLTTANALWAHHTVRFEAEFLERVNRFLRAGAHTVDFADPQAPAIINNWVSEATNGMIRDIVTAADLSPLTHAIATSTVHFKAAWEEVFQREDTREGLFTLEDGRQKLVPLMRRSYTGEYLQTEACEVVRLPYAGARVALYLFLPARGSSLAEFQRELSADSWFRWMNGFRVGHIDLSLPRFRVECQVDLVEPLAALGMEVAFTPAADFLPMGLAGHFLQQVRHKAMMEVNEEGTEAGAATVTGYCLGLSPLPEWEVVIDRPFFCAIRDRESESILFMGAITDPEID
jgi:serine protease inhibitor